MRAIITSWADTVMFLYCTYNYVINIEKDTGQNGAVGHTVTEQYLPAVEEGNT